MEWADANNSVFSHYFNYVNLNRAIHHIKDGKISCWVILNCDGGKEMLNKFTDDQLDFIAAALDMPFWVRKFRENPADVALVKEICKEAGIE